MPTLFITVLTITHFSSDANDCNDLQPNNNNINDEYERAAVLEYENIDVIGFDDYGEIPLVNDHEQVVVMNDDVSVQSEVPAAVVQVDGDIFNLKDLGSLLIAGHGTRVLTRGQALQRYRITSFLSDGAFPQMKAVLGSLVKFSTESGQHHMIWMKYAAGCSMTQQANDTGKMHAIARNKFQSGEYKYKGNRTLKNDKQYQLVNSVLNESKMSKPSVDTFMDCIYGASDILQSAFSPTNIRSAFAAAGTVIIDANGKATASYSQILEHCPHYEFLSAVQKEFVLSTIPEFSEIMSKEGYIPENEFTRILAPMKDVDNGERTPGSNSRMEMGDKCTSNQRALIVTSHQWLDKLAKRREKIIELAADSNDPTAAGSKKRGRTKKDKNKIICCNGKCERVVFLNNVAVGGANTSSSATTDFDQWIKCLHCSSVYSCPAPDCQYFLEHYHVCPIKPPRKISKKLTK